MKKTQLILFLLVSLFILQTNLYSQNFARPNDWKKFRKEIIIGAGISNFLGDLGGLDKVGTDYSPVDLEISLTRPAFTLGYRYKIFKQLNVAATLNYLLLVGDDSKTKDFFRQNRNLYFKSNVFEASFRVEYSLMRSKVGHRYGIKNTLSRRASSRATDILVFSGINAFYHNPKARDGSALYNYNTEGQGLPNGPKKYSRYAISIPIGVAYRVFYSKKICIGLEVNYRKTFTDYIDDVSTVYYDPIALASAYGDKAPLLADPNLGNIKGGTNPGEQRGDSKQKDAYMSVQITVGYFLKTKKTSRTRLRSKF